MISTDPENPDSNVEKLENENFKLKEENRELLAHLTEKINQLLVIMGTKPLKPHELEESSIVAQDLLGTIALSFKQVLEHQKETNIELEKSKEFLNTLVQTAPNGLFTIDIKGNITSWNDNAEKISGFSKEQVVGKTCIFKKYCKECLLLDPKVKKSILDREFAYMGPNGNLKHLSQNMDILKDEMGYQVGGIVSFVDITERKKAEEALEKYRYHLEELVEGRTEELTQANRKLREEMKIREKIEEKTRGKMNFLTT